MKSSQLVIAAACIALHGVAMCDERPVAREELQAKQPVASTGTRSTWRSGTEVAIKRSEPTFDEYIRNCAVPKSVIDRFLSGPAWAQFDAELGYVQRDFVRHDAIDRSSAIYTFGEHGARTSFLYANRRPRINTYGDSFTEGEQVNDGETWQEYLAAHLGEPIGNYGVGSYGVYQAYRRMIREEKSSHGAQYVIFYIWGDDPTRSLMRCRYCYIYQWFRKSAQYEDGGGFHANFWPNIEMDPRTGRFVERPNLLQTPEALYRMTDPEWMVDHLNDDLALQLAAYSEGSIRDIDRKRIGALAAHLDFPFDWGPELSTDSSALARRRSLAGRLLNRYSQRATIFVLEKARNFTNKNGKKLLIVLFDPYGSMNQLRQGAQRDDQETIDYLARAGFEYFDMNEVHVRDFKNYNVSWEDYLKKYFIGHYNPAGNHFFAFSIKDKFVNWLNPKPITYQNPAADALDFKGYLHGYK